MQAPQPAPLGSASPDEVVARLGTDIAAVLGDRLFSLAAHGSWVSGDFRLGRSDVDLLAVLRDDPGPAELQALRVVHDAIEHDLPEWAGHVEVGYVAVDAVRDLVMSADLVEGSPDRHPMLRISPGEPIDVVPASRHHALNWDAAVRANHAVVGSAPASVLPAVPDDVVRAVLAEHLQQWPEWLGASQHVGFHAYAVLTVARSAE